MKDFFNDMLGKVKSVGLLAVAAAVAGFTAYLVGVDAAAAFGPTAGAVFSFAVAYWKREGSTRVIEYLENHAKDDGDIVPV